MIYYITLYNYYTIYNPIQKSILSKIPSHQHVSRESSMSFRMPLILANFHPSGATFLDWPSKRSKALMLGTLDKSCSRPAIMELVLSLTCFSCSALNIQGIALSFSGCQNSATSRTGLPKWRRRTQKSQLSIGHLIPNSSQSCYKSTVFQPRLNSYVATWLRCSRADATNIEELQR